MKNACQKAFQIDFVFRTLLIPQNIVFGARKIDFRGILNAGFPQIRVQRGGELWEAPLSFVALLSLTLQMSLKI